MVVHVIGIALMLLAFGVVIVGASYVFAVTAEREPECTPRAPLPSAPAHRSSSPR
jgi:hypothetical protein